jgi:hypothetical protein
MSLRARILAVLASSALLVPLTAGTAHASPSGITLVEATVDPGTVPRGVPLGERCGLGGLNHPLCGLGTVEFTLSGFDAYGGVPECTDENCPDDLAVLVEGAPGPRMDFVVRCAGEPWLRYASVPITVQAYGYPSSVGGYSRVDSDTVRVGGVFTMPSGLDLGTCPEDSTFAVVAVLRSVSLSFEPTEAGLERGVPAWTSRTWRPYLVPSPVD